MQDPKKLPKSHHLGTIAQVCRAISLQQRHISTIGKKKLVKQQYLLHMSPEHGELWPTSGWDRSGSLEHPCKFQQALHLGSVTARHSSSGRQPNFATLNRERHLYSAGRSSRWALAHISSIICFLGYPSQLNASKSYKSGFLQTGALPFGVYITERNPFNGLLFGTTWVSRHQKG